jgi:hypothetical protein
MCGLVYYVRVCDVDPMSNGPKNIVEFKFSSRRRAYKFAEDALSRGMYAILNRVDVGPEPMWPADAI